MNTYVWRENQKRKLGAFTSYAPQIVPDEVPRSFYCIEVLSLFFWGGCVLFYIRESGSTQPNPNAHPNPNLNPG